MTDVITLGERVARMEEKLANVLSNQSERKDRDEALEEKMDFLLKEFGKAKGFIGGVLFVVGCIVAFIKMGIPYILKLLGKD